ncbi:hypothetical protein VNI00_013466 [Paramarasmius palmivorus]|uniref:Bacteriophage T5 Orf172 DNA-binding domain-containing protein n=1 Tax=Paramarasmius palmivorus TaxID=297713 RepID=A0AAW0C1K6_9AGAR
MVSLIVVVSSAALRNKGLSPLNQLLDVIWTVAKFFMFAILHPFVCWRRLRLSYTLCRSLNHGEWAIFEAAVRKSLHRLEAPGFVYAFRINDHPNKIQRVKIGCTIDLLSARRQTNAHLARFAVTPLSANFVRYHYKTKETLVNLLFKQHIVVGQCMEPSCNTSHTEYFVLANDLQHQIHDVVAVLDAFLTVYQPA